MFLLLVKALKDAQSSPSRNGILEGSLVAAPPSTADAAAACRPVVNQESVPLFIRWDDYLPQHLSSARNISFLQIGAHCGMNTPRCAVGGDPVWEYVASCGWRGTAGS